jgi:hypothetical protein
LINFAQRSGRAGLFVTFAFGAAKRRFARLNTTARRFSRIALLVAGVQPFAALFNA